MDTPTTTSSRGLTGTFAIVCAVLAVTVVYLGAQTHTLKRKLEETQPQPIATKPNQTAANTRDAATLRRLLEEKDAAYIQLEDKYRALQRQGQNHNVEPPRGRAVAETSSATSTNNSRMSWMDRIKQEDPERYKQMVEEREKRRKQTDEWFQNQIAGLDQRAQTAMTKEEAEVATKLADTYAKANELRNQWSQLRELPDDQRAAAFEQLRTDSRQVYQDLNTLRLQDRQIQLDNLARTVGYTDAASIKTFTDTISTIYNNTQYDMHMPRADGGHGGRGGGGPPATNR